MITRWLCFSIILAKVSLNANASQFSKPNFQNSKRNFEESDDYDLDTLKQKLIKMIPKPMLGDTKYTSLSLPSEEKPVDIDSLFALVNLTLDDHEVLTKDGWILTLHRINRRGFARTKVIFLMHGMFGSSEDWMYNPKHNLPVMLFDAGYDVWLGNARGNRYGKAHSSISVDCDEYWDFSWDEVGRYDISASLQYILKKTRKPKLYYVGYSQGATSGFIALTENQDLNDKIDTFFAIAPVTYLTHTDSPLLKSFATESQREHDILRHIGTENLHVHKKLVSSIAKILCKNGTLSQYVCSNFLFDLCGFTIKKLNVRNLPLIMKRWPSTGSSRNLLHYIQVVDSGKFRPYVFNESKNELIYDAKMPPEYNLTYITAPVVLIYSKSDWLTNEMDVETLSKKLESVVKTIVVKDYTHTDFIFGNDAIEKVFKKVTKYLKSRTTPEDEGIIKRNGNLYHAGSF